MQKERDSGHHNILSKGWADLIALDVLERRSKISRAVGRNESCPCGSGRKYKHCCGSIAAPAYLRKEFKPKDLIGVLSRRMGIPLPPKAMLLRPVDPETRAADNKALERCASALANLNSPKWPADRIERATRVVTTYIKKTAADFNLGICDTRTWQAGMRDEPTIATAILWNEIDQYKYLFRSRTRALITDRVHAFLRNAADPATSLAIVRQLLETTCQGVACQWVLNTLFSNFTSNFDHYSIAPGLTCTHLENFLISITLWNQDQARSLGEIIGDPMAGVNDLMKEIYRPASDKMLGVVGFLAEWMENHQEASPGELTQPVAKLSGIYPFLCKFAHPSALMFPMKGMFRGKPGTPSDDKLASAAIAGFFEVMECCHTLLERLFLPQVFDEMSFAVVMLGAAMNYGGSESAICEIRAPLVEQFMKHNEAKIILECDEGPLEIFNRGRKLAKPSARGS